ncbi:DUF554 domain-containing protein [uncultured Oscillibacter sp.]|uniref:DUF554 domain-containing protein n=1 Tax=uncultured Oscillibacter sp. TaxID=876091 RepID=UPI0025D606EC|nr:DUF554 domain-containing protein [uncultured Oscillibacter sp.]
MLVGTLVNTGTVIAGSLIGMLLGNILPERLRDTVMKGLGLCTVFIGVTGMLGGSNALITIISVAVGAVIGELCDLDGHLERFAGGLEARFKKSKGGRASLAEGFVTASLVFCVGAMTIVGALNDGLTGDHEMLFTKATLDFVSSMIFASSLGIGVLMAAAAVFTIEGGIAALASLVAPLLQQDPATIPEMTVVGSVLIVGLGLNLLGVTKLKIMNYVPAIFLPILLCVFM